MSETATARRFGVDTDGLGAVAWAAIGLALVSAGVHLLLGALFGLSGLGVALLLAGAGYVGAVALVLLDYRRRLLYAAGVPYTLVQILLWYWINYGSAGRSLATVGPLEVVDKVAQVGLVVALVALYRAEGD